MRTSIHPDTSRQSGDGQTRRTFLGAATGAVAFSALTSLRGAAPIRDSLAGEIGLTTGSFMRHLSAEAAPGKLRLLDLPQLMRDELGMRVMDLMTATLVDLSPVYLDALRAAADRAGCVLTNLKMNQPGLDLGHPDLAVRRHAITSYKLTMDAAARLGVRWVRPLPAAKRPDYAVLAEGLRELIDYGSGRGLGVLIENFGWLMDDPDAIPAVIRATGAELKAQPDTGNWTDAARYAGLAKAFPFAVTCDFKAFQLDANDEHPRYDLKRCFQTGWDAGYRGPWCFEHFHTDLKGLVRGMGILRDRIRQWTREAQGR